MLLLSRAVDARLDAALPPYVHVEDGGGAEVARAPPPLAVRVPAGGGVGARDGSLLVVEELEHL